MTKRMTDIMRSSDSKCPDAAQRPGRATSGEKILVSVIAIALRPAPPLVELVLILMLPLKLIMSIVVLILQLAMKLSVLPGV